MSEALFYKQQLDSAIAKIAELESNRVIIEVVEFDAFDKKNNGYIVMHPFVLEQVVKENKDYLAKMQELEVKYDDLEDRHIGLHRECDRSKAEVIREMLVSGELHESEGLYLGGGRSIPAMISKQSIIEYIAKLRESKDD